MTNHKSVGPAEAGEVSADVAPPPLVTPDLDADVREDLIYKAKRMLERGMITKEEHDRIVAGNSK
jgi:hypothetical protein